MRLRSGIVRLLLAQLVSCLALLLLTACRAPVEVDLPAANPGAAAPEGLSWLSRQALDGYLRFSAWIGSDSGYVALFARDGVVVYATTAGLADIESGRPMTLDTRFRMASMTKPITAVAALILIEDGRLELDDPVAAFVPAARHLRVATSHEFAADGKIPTVPLDRPLTVRHLLTFTSGIGSKDDPSDLGQIWKERDIYAGSGSLAERVDRLLTAPLYEVPGDTWRYGWSADVLARVVEVAAREPFDRFVKRKILTPLGMSSTSFLPPEGARGDLATMYTLDENGDLVPVPSPASDALDWTPGGSGLVSTAGDYMRFALMLWNGGSYDGARLLTPESVALMTHPQVPSGVLVEEGIDGLGWGLGLAVVVDSKATPMRDHDGDFWWSGYYGTNFFVSPETGLTGVILAQHQPNADGDRSYAVHVAPALAF